MGSVRFKRLNDLVPIPCYAKPGDVGLDLTAVAIEKKYERCVLFNTGIAVQPPEGYHFKLYNRSSTHKLGYCLANNVGVIDEGYTGFIMAPLMKLDDTALHEDEVIGKRIVQLVLEKSYTQFHIHEVEMFNQTSRGDSGFGSSGK
tara:strand:+ start:1901 stop:2335 length:435 start_codon:yes stop_codon:yes gene_type:complete